jgi:hypothetical protein
VEVKRMSFNMPAGATSDEYDRWCGYDEPDEEECEPEPEETEENEIEVITEAEMLKALAEDAGDRAYDQQEEDRLFPLGPLTVGPFEPPVPHMAPLAEGPQQGTLFKEVA